jgi:BirA family biotin operon repressor/biotin-[acetyl-CoA-carboxylase] ligase
MTGAASDIRERLLARLSEEPGQFISGEVLSREMAMTRAAVWKHMRALRQDGWPLQCVTRRGYRIPAGRMLPYSAAGIRFALRFEEFGGFGADLENSGNTAGVWEKGITGNKGRPLNLAVDGNRPDSGAMDWRIAFLEKTDSTSSRMKELAAQDAPEGTVLFAEEQSGGRGRMGRNWSSRRGMGIWMSVLLRPEMAPDQVQSITLAVSVAVVETLRAFISEVLSETDSTAKESLSGSIGIKWPNDIWQNGKKICGILTELAAEPEKLSHVIIGIGINVFQSIEDFPPELQSTATSLRLMLSAGSPVETLRGTGATTVRPDAKKVCDTGTIAARTDAELLYDTGTAAEIPESGPILDRNRLAALLLKHLSGIISEHRHEGMPGILQRWRAASVTLGREIRVADPVSPWNAQAVDVAEDGRLVVERPDGTRTYLLSGEISIR